MEGDDEPDRPLDLIDPQLQIANLIDVGALIARAFAMSPQEQLRMNVTNFVEEGCPAVNLADEAWSYVILPNEKWSHGSAEDVRRDRRIVLEALMGNHTILIVWLGYHFLTSVGPTLPNEGDSTSYLRTTLLVIGNLPSLRLFTVEGLPGSPETINTRVLLESMATFQNDPEVLELTDIEFRSNSEVQLLADFLGSRGGELTQLFLEVLIPVVNDDMAGFLDPILLAMASSSGASYLLPSSFELSGSGGVSVSGVSLISEAALCSFLPCFDFNTSNRRALYLKGLGLGDRHVKLIAELMPTVFIPTLQGASASLSLHLQSNPAIGLPGYEALLGMLGY
jgi:hypothetical protein